MENLSSTSSQPRIGFYPCCAGDIEEPRRFLAPYVDEILFCDLKQSRAWNAVCNEPGLPVATFLQGDARELIPTLPPICVLFYRNDSSGEGGSRLKIVGRVLLHKILTRFDRDGGWIFTDGANSDGGKHFEKLLGVDGYGKPSWGFHLRKVNGFDLRNRLGAPVHAIKVSPLPPSVPWKAMRAGWVPPRDYTFDSLDALWEFCTANNRLVPKPPQWTQLYGILKNTHQNLSGGWEPPLPLVLAAWHHSKPLEKQLRFKEQLRWAVAQNQLPEMNAFLRSLPETHWCHFGEV
jgi:hypothetical protein